MKVRLIPVLSTFILTAGLLFGGWFAYQSMAVESPLYDMVKDVKGVSDASISLSRNQLWIQLHLNQEAELSTLYRDMLKQSHELAGNRTVHLEIIDQSSEALNQIWQKGLFDLAEAMAAQRYGSIPDLMQELADETPGLQAETAMDEHHVYITLKLEDAAKYAVLPRDPARLGVWPVEQI